MSEGRKRSAYFLNSDSDNDSKSSSECEEPLYTTFLDKKKIYRYLYFDDGPSADISLNIFYGEDRSFSYGCLFDIGPIVVEFDILIGTEKFPIEHHPNCFRGNLKEDNTIITRIFIDRLTESLLFTEKGTPEFVRKSKEFVTKIGTNFPKEKIIFYDIYDWDDFNINCFISRGNTS